MRRSFGALENLRRSSADAARDQFDFGGDIIHTDDWIEDGRDQLTCAFQIAVPTCVRKLMLRVNFLPESDVAHHVSVAERMALV